MLNLDQQKTFSGEEYFNTDTVLELLVFGDDTGQNTNGWKCLCSNKTLFIKIGSRQDSVRATVVV